MFNDYLAYVPEVKTRKCKSSKADLTLQLFGYSHISILGDILDLPEQKQIDKATTHAAVVAANVLACLSGRPLQVYKGSKELIVVTISQGSGAITCFEATRSNIWYYLLERWNGLSWRAVGHRVGRLVCGASMRRAMGYLERGKSYSSMRTRSLSLISLLHYYHYGYHISCLPSIY